MAPIRFSASVSLMFREDPVDARFAAARKAGFAGVEIQVLDEAAPAVLARAAADAEVEVVLVNVGMGDLRAGGPGLSGVPGREAAFRAELERTLAAAALLGADLVHLGPSRVPDGVPRTECLAAYRRNLALAADLCAGRVRPVIEPLNVVDMPTVLLSDFDEAAALIGEIGADRLGLQFDIYHAAMNGLDPTAVFARHLPLIRHIQFSDAPGRHEPGTGTVDFDGVFATIAASPYAGWTGAEYLPSKATAETTGWLTSYETRFGR